MSRGGKEGNNALTKTPDAVTNYAEFAMAEGASITTLKAMVAHNVVDVYDLYSDVAVAIRKGHLHLGIEYTNEKYDPNFSHFFREAMMPFDKVAKIWENLPPREASIQKKGSDGVTPFHCASINPDIRALKKFYSICPEIEIKDSLHRTLVHFAAACKTSFKPLEFIFGKGRQFLGLLIEMEQTPLIVACVAGSVANVEYLLSKAKKDPYSFIESEEALKRFGICAINRPQRNSFCAIHHAVVSGNLRVVECLMKYGVDLEKPLNTKYFKLTPLMLAAAHGDLPMVRLLVEKGLVKVEKKDKVKRTALVHAVMNGATTVASYLLNLGADPNAKDSSDNHCLHYACAYGWAHCLELLADAGADPNRNNCWGLNPMAVAYLKGHSGLVKRVMDIPGADINSKDDKGRNFVMGLVNYNCTNGILSEILLKDVEDLVRDRAANPLSIDTEGKNMLHYLTKLSGTAIGCHFNCNEDKKKDQEKYSKGNMQAMDLQTKFVQLALNYGCDPLAVDESGRLPIDCFGYYFGKYYKRKNYSMLHVLLDAMVERVEEPQSSLENFKVRGNVQGLLNRFFCNLNLYFIKEERHLFEKIVRVLKSLENRDLIKMKDFVNGTNDRTAPAIVLTKAYNKKCSFTSFKNDIECFWKEEVEGNELGYWREARGLFLYFIKSCKPDLVHQTQRSQNQD